MDGGQKCNKREQSFKQDYDLSKAKITNEHRINVVSSGLVEDAIEKYETYFPGHNPIPMKKVINGYVKSVEGKGTGEIIRMYDNC